MFTFIHPAWNDAGKENFRWLLDHVQCCIAEASEARQINESRTQSLLLTLGKLELQHRELQDSITKAMQMEEALEKTRMELSRAKQSTNEVFSNDFSPANKSIVCKALEGLMAFFMHALCSL